MLIISSIISLLIRVVVITLQKVTTSTSVKQAPSTELCSCCTSIRMISWRPILRQLELEYDSKLHSSVFTVNLVVVLFERTNNHNARCSELYLYFVFYLFACIAYCVLLLLEVIACCYLHVISSSTQKSMKKLNESIMHANVISLR